MGTFCTQSMRFFVPFRGRLRPSGQIFVPKLGTFYTSRRDFVPFRGHLVPTGIIPREKYRETKRSKTVPRKLSGLALSGIGELGRQTRKQWGDCSWGRLGPGMGQ